MIKNTKLFSLILFVIFAGIFSGKECLAFEQAKNDSAVFLQSDDEDPDLEDEFFKDEEFDPSIIEEAENNPEGFENENFTDPEANKTPAPMTKDQELMLKVISITNEQAELQKKIKDELSLPEARSKFFVRLFGADFANIEKIRNNISLENEKTQELEGIVSEAESQSTKKVLNRVLDESKKVEASLENELKKKEGVFSLFGWLVKLFY